MCLKYVKGMIEKINTYFMIVTNYYNDLNQIVNILMNLVDKICAYIYNINKVNM